MTETTKIEQHSALSAVLSQIGVQVVSEEGNVYWRLPDWLKQSSADFKFEVIEDGDLPDDLSMMITRSRLGGDNLKIPKL